MSRAVLEEMTASFQFQINKYGSYGSHLIVEEAVNGLTNFELLELIANYIESNREREVTNGND